MGDETGQLRQGNRDCHKCLNYLTRSSWIGNHWAPPNGWRYFSTKELRIVYKDKSIMLFGDSIARRAVVITLSSILKAAANASNANAP